MSTDRCLNAVNFAEFGSLLHLIPWKKREMVLCNALGVFVMKEV